MIIVFSILLYLFEKITRKLGSSFNQIIITTSNKPQKFIIKICTNSFDSISFIYYDSSPSIPNTQTPSRDVTKYDLSLILLEFHKIWFFSRFETMILEFSVFLYL